ncbi:MAG: YitT family protein, partial [Oscillospiraceae bacterium]
MLKQRTGDFMLKKSQEKFNAKTFVIDSLLTIVGTFIFAVAIHFFTAPNQIAPGGVTGISTIVNFITKIPIGTIYILINIPLIVIGLIYLGKWFMIKTFISIVSFTIFSDYILKNL